MEAIEQVSVHKQCSIQFRGGPMAYAPN